MRKLENEEIREWGNIVSLFNFGKGASRTGSVSNTGKNFSKVYTPKSDIFELSEENEDFQKKTEGSFDEKRV